MIWSSNIIYLIKYWKAGGVILLIAAFFISAHLAKSRGEKLDIAEQALETERQKFARQLNQIEKARQNEKERNEFRKSQNRKIKLADDAALRDVYDLMRERQRNTVSK